MKPEEKKAMKPLSIDRDLLKKAESKSKKENKSFSAKTCELWEKELKNTKVSIEERKEKFISLVKKETEDICVIVEREFIAYWTEKSPKGKKMRFEKQDVFDVKRRLMTWQKKAKEFNPEKQKSKQSSFD